MLSCAMIVLNEEATVAKALNSIIPYVDEVVVVDGGSEDRTREIVTTFPKVCMYENPWSQDFSLQRNFAIEKAGGDWIFSLDADQHISPYVGQAFSELIRQKEYDAFSFYYYNVLEGQPIGLLSPPRPREKLFRRYCYWRGQLHERLIGYTNMYNLNLHVFHEKTRASTLRSNQTYWDMGQAPDKGWRKEMGIWIPDLSLVSYAEAIGLVNYLSQDGVTMRVVQWGPEFSKVCECIQEFFEGKRHNFILEIGSYTGGSLLVLSKTLSMNGILASIEPMLETPLLLRLVKKVAAPHEVCHIPHLSSSIEAIEEVEELVGRYGKATVLHIDGDSSFSSCMTDFLIYEKYVDTPGMIVMHDVVTETGPRQAYNLIKRFYSDLFTDAQEVYEGGTGSGILYRR